MGLEPGTLVGTWVVEEPLDDSDRYRCHLLGTPFRKAVLRVVRAADAAKLEEEARHLTRLSHPSIQSVIGVESSGDDLYLVTEAAHGTFLDAFLGQPPLQLQAVLDVACQLADALTTAHAQGIAHGDLRPRNVLLTPEGKAILVGFDLRSSLDRPALGSGYTAPEAMGGETARDAYAFGVLLYSLASGQHAPEAGAPLELPGTAAAVLQDLVEALTHADPEARPELRTARDNLRMALRTSLGEERSTAPDTFMDLDDLPTDPGSVAAPGHVGRYRIVREIGRGGVGVVYEAEDADLHRHVALKVLLAGSFARGRDIERFMREARAVARLDHPAIVKILELGREAGQAWFAMEFVDGPTLLDKVRDEGGLDWTEAVTIGAQLAHALQHAHDQGLVHRDVKPNNILLEGGVTPRLTDFGLALDDVQETRRLTKTGQVLGTPMYMSPEQAVGDLDKLGPCTDVYALGVVLYEAISGEVPFPGSNPLQIIGRVLAANAAPLRSHVPTLPPDVELVIHKAMRGEIAERYPSAGELAADLERCLSGEPVRASRPTFRARARWFARRNRIALSSAAAVVVVIGIGLMSLGFVVRQQQLQAEQERQELAAERLVAAQQLVSELEAEGDAEGAARAWNAFALRPEHRDTDALFHGWLARADAADQRGDSDGAQAALSRAYADASTPDHQEDALMRLARSLRASERFDELSMVAETLHARVGDGDAELAALRRDAAVAQRAFGRAGALSGSGPEGRVVRALAAATRTGHRADTLRPWYGEDGDWVLRDADADELVVVRADAALSSSGTVRLPVPLVPTRVWTLDDPEPTLIAGVRGGGTVVLSGPRDGLVVAQSWAGGITAAASGDLDGDGRAEHYFGADRGLWKLERDASGAWVRWIAHRGTHFANSEIEDLLIADFDGDGPAELAVAASQWGAYDVRLLGPGGPDGGLQLLGRHKLGAVAHLGLLERGDGLSAVLVSKVDKYPNTLVFPAEQPLGAPQGLWRLDWDATDLQAERVLDELSCADLHSGDLDGDGVTDIAANCGDDLLLLPGRATGGGHPMRIVGVRPLAIANLDDDPADELVVRLDSEGGDVWVLGTGTDAAPELTPLRMPRLPAPPDADDAFALAWDRAEDLASFGQTEHAADSHQALADLAWGAPEGIAATMRAADLHAEGARWRQAATLYAQAATLGRTERALSASARAWRSAHDARSELQALQWIDEKGELDDDQRARMADLRYLEDVTRAELTFAQALDERWKIEDPFALRRDRFAALQITAYGRRVLARLPVAWDGRHLAVEVELEAATTEWDAGIAVGLAPAGSDHLLYGVRIDGRGGGQVYHRRAQCLASGFSAEQRIAMSGASTRLRVETLPGREGISCSFEADGVAWTRTEASELPEPLDERWELVILATGGTTTSATAALESIALEGVTVDSAEPADRGPAAAGRRALVDGQLDRAAELLLQTGDLEGRAALAAELRQEDELVEALDPLAGSRGTGPGIQHLLHTRLDAHAPALREVLGDDYWIAFFAAWQTTLHAHQRERFVRDTVLQHLHGLDEAEPRDAEDATAMLYLLSVRGAAATGDGYIDVARASLERALELHGELEGDTMDRVLVDVYANLAALAAMTGARDQAMALLEEGLLASPSPEVSADELGVRDDLKVLRAHPRWDDVIERHR